MSIAHLLNSTCNVYAITETQSDTGGLVEAEVDKHLAMPCLIEIATGVERELLGREGVIITHILFTTGDYNDITEKDRIKSGGKTFDVVLVDDVQDRAHHMEIKMEERK